MCFRRAAAAAGYGDTLELISLWCRLWWRDATRLIFSPGSCITFRDDGILSRMVGREGIAGRESDIPRSERSQIPLYEIDSSPKRNPLLKSNKIYDLDLKFEPAVLRFYFTFTLFFFSSICHLSLFHECPPNAFLFLLKEFSCLLEFRRSILGFFTLRFRFWFLNVFIARIHRFSFLTLDWSHDSSNKIQKSPKKKIWDCMLRFRHVFDEILGWLPYPRLERGSLRISGYNGNLYATEAHNGWI